MEFKVTFKPVGGSIDPVTYTETANSRNEAWLKAELKFVVEHCVFNYEPEPEIENI